MKNGILKPDHAREIGAAMAVIRQGEEAMRSPAPESFDLYCECAVYDKPYTLRFTRQPSGLLRLMQSVKGKPSSSPDNARAGGVGWALRLDYFERTAMPCAWCGDQSFHHCASYCGALVCGGRMKGNTFHCRKSCGASWIGVPLREVKGRMRREASLSRPSLSQAAKPSALSSKPMLLLGAGHARWGK
jgi:hypothetical protein